MPTLTYISPNNEETTVEAEIGLSLMEIAVNNDIEGIDADCGGSCACATCHVIIPHNFLGKTGLADDDECALLDFLDNRTMGSRLSCQIEMREDFDGMIIKIPTA